MSTQEQLADVPQRLRRALTAIYAQVDALARAPLRIERADWRLRVVASLERAEPHAPAS